eukprot:gene5627-6491_t
MSDSANNNNNNNSKKKEVSVPAFFPAVTAECKEKAARFFICIERSMSALNEEDLDAPRRGLRSCEPDMILYRDCMISSLARGAEKTFT